LRGNKKTRQNRFRPDVSVSTGLHFDFMESLDLCLKFIMVVILISLVSLLFIFLHDVLTQARYFSLKKISVSGYSRISRPQVLKQAGVVPGENIFAINLFKVKKRLVANEWIADASVARDIPSGLAITIKEEKPMAVVKLGNKAEFLINDKGVPFTAYDQHTDKMNLPLVQGLNLENKDGIYGFSGRAFNSVMKLLSASYPSKSRGREVVPCPGESPCPVNFLKKIREIAVDQDMGLSLKVAGFPGTADPQVKMGIDPERLHRQENFDTVIEIKMGFDRYGARYRRIGRIMNYLKANKINKKICSMDLSDLGNVIVKFEGTQNRDNFHSSIKGGV